MNENTEVTEMQKNLYNPVIYNMEEAEKILERIEKFNPKEHLRTINSEGGTSYYLDTKDRIVWFRKTFPLGRVYKIPIEIKEDYATFEVRVYVDRNDPYENFIANGFATRRKDETNAEFGLNFIESAETAALGRALKDAGFGTQSCGMDIKVPEEDSQMVDAGIPVKSNSDETGIGGRKNGADDTDMPETATGTTPSSDVNTSTGTGSTEQKMTKPKEEPKPVKLTKDMEVEELVKLMTVDYAEKLVVEYGADSGKTLGYLNKSKPNSMEYHATCSKNNLIKAGAILLIAEKKKSE